MFTVSLLSYEVPLYDEILFKDLFRFGLNEPNKLWVHWEEVIATPQMIKMSASPEPSCKIASSPGLRARLPLVKSLLARL